MCSNSSGLAVITYVNMVISFLREIARVTERINTNTSLRCCAVALRHDWNLLSVCVKNITRSVYIIYHITLHHNPKQEISFSWNCNWEYILIDFWQSFWQPRERVIRSTLLVALFTLSYFFLQYQYINISIKYTSLILNTENTRESATGTKILKII